MRPSTDYGDGMYTKSSPNPEHTLRKLEDSIAQNLGISFGFSRPPLGILKKRSNDNNDMCCTTETP